MARIIPVLLWTVPVFRQPEIPLDGSHDTTVNGDVCRPGRYSKTGKSLQDHYVPCPRKHHGDCVPDLFLYPAKTSFKPETRGLQMSTVGIPVKSLFLQRPDEGNNCRDFLVIHFLVKRKHDFLSLFIHNA